MNHGTQSSVPGGLVPRQQSLSSILDIVTKLIRTKTFESVHLLRKPDGYEAAEATDGHHLCNGVVGVHPDYGQIAIFWPQHDGSRMPIFCSRQIADTRI